MGQFTLTEGESVRLKFTIRRSDGLPFRVGTHAVVCDLSEFLVSLRSDDAQPWTGNAKRVDVRRIIVQEVLSNDDRINFLSLEGNYHLGAVLSNLAVVTIERAAFPVKNGESWTCAQTTPHRCCPN